MTDRRHTRVIAAVLALAALFSGVFAGDAAAGSRRHSRSRSRSRTSHLQRTAAQFAMRQAKARLAAAQRVSAAAKQQAAAARAKIQYAAGRTQSALSDISSANADYADSNSGRKSLEAAIEAGQPDDSEFARARREWEQADKGFQAEQNRVLNSPTYKAKYERALHSIHRTQLLPKVRSETLANDSEYQQAKARLKSAEFEYDLMRRKLYQQNKDWVAAVKSTKDAGGAQANAQGKLRGSLFQKASGKASLRRATAAAATAQSVIRQSQATLRHLQSVASRYRGSKRYSHHHYSKRRH